MAVSVVISANSSAFVSAMKSAQKSMQNLQSAVASASKVIAVSLAGAFTALSAATIAGIKHVLEIGGRLSDLSDQTGISAGNLLVLQQAFQDAGLGADEVGSSINKMQRSIENAIDGSDSLIKTFGSLGIIVSDLKGLSPDEQFKKIAESISRIEDPAKKAQLTMQIFGRGAGRMMALFNNPEALEEASKTIGDQAEIFNKNAATFDRASDLLNSISKKMQGLFAGIAEQVAPSLLAILEMINNIDLAGAGQKIGSFLMDSVKIFYGAIKADKLGELIGLGFTVGIENGINYFVGAMKYVVDLVSELLSNTFQTQSLGLADYLIDAIGSAIIAIGSLITSVFLKAFETPIRFLKAGFEFAVQKAIENLYSIIGAINPLLAKGLELSGLKTPKAQTFSEVYAGTESSIAGLTSNDFSNAAKEFGKMAKESIVKAGKETANIFDNVKFEKANIMGDSSDKLSKLSEELKKAGELPSKFIETKGKKAGGFGGFEMLPEMKTQGVAAVASSLAAVGGGGGFAAGGFIQVAQKQLDEQKKHTKLLERIEQGMESGDLVLG